VRPESALRQYQRDAEEFVATRKRGLLWLDVGLGKTAAIASALSAGYKRTRNIRTLVLSTKAIAQAVWIQELEQWEHLAWLAPKARCLVGLSAKKREAAIFSDQETRLDTLNYDHIPWLHDQLSERNMSLGQLYDCVICDEITKLKNPYGKWFKLMCEMVHPDHVPYFWGLTGSPASEGYAQVYAPMYLCDYGYRLGFTYQQFLDNHFIQVGSKLYTKRGHADIIKDKIRDVVMSVEVPPGVLPEMMHNPRHLFMTDHDSRAYMKLEREMYVNLEQGSVMAANAGVLIGKCLQYTSGAMYLSDESGAPTPQWETVHTLKLEALASVYEELGGQNLMVVVQYRHEIQRILDVFPEAVHMNSDNILDVEKRWNAGTIRMLVAHPLSCGHGLNLQFGGGDICFTTLPYSLEQFDQAIGRLARPGQKKPTVMVHMLLVHETVDHAAWAALQGKSSIQEELKASMSASRHPSLKLPSAD